MKNYYLFFALLLAQGINAQTLPYTFSVDQGTYSPLTNAISVNNGATWDDDDYQLPLSFAFKLYGQTIDSLYLYSELTSFIAIGINSDPTPLLFSYGADLIDRGIISGVSQSSISYKVDGTSGSRIFKIEWANAGFYEDDSNTDFINTQLWLFEGSNIIEMHFGPKQVNNPFSFSGFTGPIFGFMDNYSETVDTVFNLWYLKGPVGNPVVTKISGQEIESLVQTVNGAPGNGLIYRFSPNVVSVNNPNQFDASFSVNPNVTKQFLSISLSDELAANRNGLQYEIMDQLGKKVLSEPVRESLQQVDMSGLSNGVYFVRLRSSNGILVTKKVVKQ